MKTLTFIYDISLTDQCLKEIYKGLIAFYKDSEDPIRSDAHDYSKSMLDVCIKKPYDSVFGKTMYPHVLHKAAVTIHSFINFHPFVDGNKRMALLSAHYYLLWNGYTLNIPEDTDDFLKDVARGYFGVNEILNWLVRNTSRSGLDRLYYLYCIYMALRRKRPLGALSIFGTDYFKRRRKRA